MAFCRDCLTPALPDATRCPKCHRPRVLSHPELDRLSIAHMDCDAFYAAIEKRDNPDLQDKPLIIGGGKRGVVSTACYIARTYGVGSAMPMFKALRACPHAVVVKPNMEKYVSVGKEIRQMMRELTPLVEPLSLDEAFLDLSGTERLHQKTPAMAMADLALRIEREIGITVSVGLSYNKFLAKIASDFDKPRGFSVIGEEEAVSFLAEQPVSLIWGVGKAFGKSLARHGITHISQLQTKDEKWLVQNFGAMGLRLYHLARGEDYRNVKSQQRAKSISSETTFNEDIADGSTLSSTLWRLCEKVSHRAKASDHAGKTVTLKLKSRDFKLRTRSKTLVDPTQLADTIYRVADDLLQKEIDGTHYRLLGVGISSLAPADIADHPNMLDPSAERRAKAERAMDALKEKYGTESIKLGRAIRQRPPK